MNRSLSGWATLWTLIGVFAGGLALNLTPCVYPLIPITVSYFSGRSTRGKSGLVGHGVCYIGGLALTNSLLGVVAALTGSLIGALLQSPLVLSVIAAVLVAFALSLFGFWELRVPFWLTKAASTSYSGFFGSFFMGVTLGIVAAPCIGPFVLGLLTWVATLGDPLIGFFIFFTLSLGLGTPLFVLAIFSGQLAKLPKSGEWMNWVRRLMGWILVGMAAYFVQPILPAVSQQYFLGIVAIAAGIHLGWLDKTTATFRLFPWVKTMVGTLCLVFATVVIGNQLFMGPSVRWHPYSKQLLADSAEKQKPVIIDFYANWCAPCRKLDQTTFHQPDIVRLSQDDFIMVKVDLTRKDARKYDHLLEEYDIKGVPTVVFIDAAGNEWTDLRLIDFVESDEFLNRMVSIK
ncbi:Cytochrome c-type biogenesis protein DsbD, protein-disulfide reductase (EC [Olavius algarvensis associated proteobacterium Delta 3]|nr:Cytochrome c-type biogenesis protein DsbD, protein-disulfide reductase (EC [Olavius algarvensis associated proteobacterium Delta 3]CAB5136616.1 Cytochrome c-type biogenesis protein DsbD, protein-disulfide reductase (EC [Olavius algarvensis associated proteobacterium Delta 3]